MAEITNSRREDFAKKIFAYERIASMIKDAATKGQGYIRISQTYADERHPRPVTLSASLKQTKAAKQLIERLKKEGYDVHWVATSLKERVGNHETGAFILFEEMRVSWCKIHIVSGPQEMPAE